MALNYGPSNPVPQCAQIGTVSAQRPPLSLQQAINELNEIAIRGRSEVSALEKLHEFLRAQMRGPVPCNPSKDCEHPHFPLNEIPDVLAGQTSQRNKLMDEIAVMMGAV